MKLRHISTGDLFRRLKGLPEADEALDMVAVWVAARLVLAEDEDSPWSMDPRDRRKWLEKKDHAEQWLLSHQLLKISTTSTHTSSNDTPDIGLRHRSAL